MSSTGTTTERSQDLDGRRSHDRHRMGPAEDSGPPAPAGGRSPTARSAGRVGDASRASSARAASDSACSATRASSRSKDRARWAPRLVPASACTSSTITVSHVPQDVPGRRGEHQEQRLRGGDQDVRRPADDLAPVPGGGVARAHADADGRRSLAQTQGGLGDAGQRCAQVALHVDRQRLERGDVEHPAALLGRRVRIPDQRVEGRQERRQGLAGPGRRDDQGVLPRRDGLPRARPGRPWARRTPRRTRWRSPG